MRPLLGAFWPSTMERSSGPPRQTAPRSGRSTRFRMNPKSTNDITEGGFDATRVPARRGGPSRMGLPEPWQGSLWGWKNPRWPQECSASLLPSHSRNRGMNRQHESSPGAELIGAPKPGGRLCYWVGTLGAISGKGETKDDVTALPTSRLLRLPSRSVGGTHVLKTGAEEDEQPPDHPHDNQGNGPLFTFVRGGLDAERDARHFGRGDSQQPEDRR
jgi:hypothetical protein